MRRWITRDLNDSFGQEVILASDHDAKVAELQREIAEFDKTFSLMHAAEIRAIKKWQEATERTLTWPDKENLTTWLLEKLSSCEARARRYDWLRKQMTWQNCWAPEDVSRIKWVVWVDMPEPYIKGPLTDETVPSALDAGIDNQIALAAKEKTNG